ncbi:alpha/beta fold hydrolase [Dactylosporangium vinaceum]|uniref:Alpha/beta fold hydrolase n=1 Tax=Dactylosporangium vinaceum TaxID=53362 RepID=A0ABV5M9W6_9ACTN|nr:alpha/beta fold hydrolase [Dactylosporangium vinaceum]UAB93144.1 alpha/beta fold hydrolase [Dactylosporangium vinaceum]
MTGPLTLPPRRAARPVDAGGVPVAVRRAGAGPVLLYLHGAGLAGRWLPLHEALAAGADVVAPDQPGCGATPARDRLRGLDDLVLHLDDLRRALGLTEPFHLAGHSFGGWLAAEFAAVYPHLVRSLTLVAPIGLAPPDGPALTVDPFAATPQELAALSFNDLPAVAAATARPAPAEAVYAHLMWQRPYSRRLPWRLRRVTCPALVLAAGGDRYVPPGVARRYRDLLPAARLHTVPGAGHALVVERPAVVAAHILGFVGAVR